jgi:hypothetical protein
MLNEAVSYGACRVAAVRPAPEARLAFATLLRENHRPFVAFSTACTGFRCADDPRNGLTIKTAAAGV